MREVIAAFRGDNYFLSNFSRSKIEFDGKIFYSAEAAFQGQKCPSETWKFCSMSPQQAKKAGRKIQLRIDWEEVKDRLMLQIVRAKFTQNATLKKKLLATGDAELIEGNTWGDQYWGVCNGKGENKLGKILMQVRDELKEEK